MTSEGRVALVEQSSSVADAEQIAVLALTRAGERDLVPGFGMPDPTFATFEPSALAAGLALWGPPVQLDDVTVVPVTDSTERVEVTFR